MNKSYILLATVLLMLITGCGGGSDPKPAQPSSEKAITEFSLAGDLETINETKKTISITMPSGTDVTALVAKFTTTGDSVKVGSTVQISGTTANNFTKPVIYTVTAADATTQDYTVTAIPKNKRPWFKVNTHTHTTQSDGSLSPEQIVSLYDALHYDVLFLTDHGTVTTADSTERMLVIAGEELGSSNNHANALFATKTINYYNRQSSDYLKDVIASGALPVLNHPGSSHKWTLQEIQLLDGDKLIEIHNAYAESVGFKDDLMLWDSLLSLGMLWYGVASDDAHSRNRIGKGWIMVQAFSLNADNIRKALEDGDFYASTGVEFSRLDFTDGIVYIESTNGDFVEFIGKNGILLLRVVGPSGKYRVKGDEGYVHVVVTRKNGAKAWTQPLFWGFTP